MVEVFWWWGWHKQLPRRKIQEMKKNMQKVPIIKAKSDKYHKKQSDEAEETLKQIKDIPKHKKNNIRRIKEEQNETIREKIRKYIKNFLKQE